MEIVLERCESFVGKGENMVNQGFSISQIVFKGLFP